MATRRMRNRFVDEGIAAYAGSHTTGPDEVQVQLQDVTEHSTGTHARMQIGDDQAALLEMLVRAMGVRRAVEVGTFTGYSGLAIARGLAPGGRLLCCDVSEEWTAIAQDHWERARVRASIDLRLGPAVDTLRGLPAEETFDFAFIDADKTGYLDYYEELVPRMRLGGILAADNALQDGRVLHPEDGRPATDDEGREADTAAIRAFNDRVEADPRVQNLLLTVGDGVMLAQRVR